MPELSQTNSNTVALLAPQELSRLERLRFTPKKRFTGRVHGERISKQKGTSLEFSDFRDYTSGDDLRRLDWNILARLRKPVIRVYQDEDDLAVYLLLDSSASMQFGEPSKLEAARRLAAALGFIGLCGQDSVYAGVLGEKFQRLRPMRGKGSYGMLGKWARSVQTPASNRSLAQSLREFARSGAIRPGIVLVISDGLDSEITDSFRAVSARGHELIFFQILSDFELNPEIEGDLRLIDSESGEFVEITAHAEAIETYRKNLTIHCAVVENALTKCGGKYVFCEAASFDLNAVLTKLRSLGSVE